MKASYLVALGAAVSRADVVISAMHTPWGQQPSEAQYAHTSPPSWLVTQSRASGGPGAVQAAWVVLLATAGLLTDRPASLPLAAPFTVCASWSWTGREPSTLPVQDPPL
jgi:hypothetical protein